MGFIGFLQAAVKLIRYSFVKIPLQGLGGCNGVVMLSNHELYYGLGMGALVTVCSRTTNVIMVSAWVLWLPYVNMYAHVYINMCVYMHICILYIRERNSGILMELYPINDSDSWRVVTRHSAVHMVVFQHCSPMRVLSKIGAHPRF